MGGIHCNVRTVFESTYLKESGWELERDGSVAVDQNFAVKGRQNIYAIGMSLL